MVMLASYECSHCTGIVTSFNTFTVEIGISPRMQRVVMNLSLGFCRPRALYSTGIANDHYEYTSAVPASASVGLNSL